MELSYDDILSIINDIFISNHYDKLSGNALLVGIKEINAWVIYFYNRQFNNMPHIKHYGHNQHIASMISMDTITCPATGISNTVKRILKLGQGHISLCGGALISIFKHININDYDLFFHCDSVEQADELLLKCMEYIQSLDTVFLYKVSQSVLTIIFENGLTIQFIKRVYKTKDQILLGFDLACCRIGYNPVDGIFATICGGISHAMKGFPLDTTQRSLSFGHRLEKYTKKDFYIFLPGLPCNINNFNTVKTPDGDLWACGNNEHRLFLGPNKDNDTLMSSYDITEDSFNWLLIANEKDHVVTFTAKTFQEIIDLPDYVIKTSIITGDMFTPPSKMVALKPYTATKFLRSNYEEFALALYVKFNFQKADSIWADMNEYYMNRGKEIAQMIKSNPWKFEDPGSQSFGKFNPIIADPREWYKDNYLPVVVGISMPRFQALMDCRKNVPIFDNTPIELIKIIGKYWFEAEVCDARKRLFALV